MQKIQLDPSSSLQKDELLGMLKSHFEPQGYKVDNTKLLGSDFYVRKSAWVGSTVSLKEKNGSKFVRTVGYSPSVWARLIIKPFIA